MELCTSTVLYGAQSLDRACAEIASVGLPAVDVWHVAGWCEHLAAGPREVASTLKRHGLRLEAVSAFGAPAKELERLLSVLAELGGHALVTGSAGPDVPVAEFAHSIEPLAQRATALGVRLAIENHGRACIDSIASMVELTRLLTEPGLGIALAPIHLWNRGEQTADALLALRGKIALAYLWDWGPTAQRDWKDPSEQFVGTGRIDFAPVIAALREIAFPRPLCVFAHGPERWPPERTTRELSAAVARVRELLT